MGLLYYITIHSNTALIVFSVRKSDYNSSCIFTAGVRYCVTIAFMVRKLKLIYSSTMISD